MIFRKHRQSMLIGAAFAAVVFAGSASAQRAGQSITQQIGIVDASSNILAREGVAQGRLRDTTFTQEQIDTVVGQVMEQFTFSAAH
ncbi:MAG: hypothetical protein QNJ73_05065 [Gammaproteobacteria bacterium]|nr:hypothetical protein [Gammaproteobacteria bacterium]